MKIVVKKLVNIRSDYEELSLREITLAMIKICPSKSFNSLQHIPYNPVFTPPPPQINAPSPLFFVCISPFNQHKWKIIAIFNQINKKRRKKRKSKIFLYYLCLLHGSNAIFTQSDLSAVLSADKSMKLFFYRFSG